MREHLRHPLRAKTLPAQGNHLLGAVKPTNKGRASGGMAPNLSTIRDYKIKDRNNQPVYDGLMLRLCQSDLNHLKVVTKSDALPRPVWEPGPKQSSNQI